MVEHLPSIDSSTYRFPTVVRQQLAAEVADPSTEVGASLSATYVSAFTPEKFGAAADGTTDDTTAVQAAIQAAYDAGGGTVMLSAGKSYRCDGQLTIPNDGLAFPGGRYIRITGAGNDGVLYPSGAGATLDLRYSGANAKIMGIPRGVLELDHFTLTDKGTSSTPFGLYTNTILNAHDMTVLGNPSKSGATCDQDFAIFGGTVAAAGGIATSGFQGYGSTVSKVQFGRIRRAAYLRVWANSIVIRDNIIASTCGAADTTAAIEIDPTADAAGQAWGNVICGNLIQMNSYAVGIRGTKAERNFFADNSFWDQGARWVADYSLNNSSTGNTLRLGGPTSNSAKHYVTDGTSFANSVVGSFAPPGLSLGTDLAGPIYLGVRTPGTKVRADAPMLIAGAPNVDGLQAPLVIQPQATTPEADGSRMFQIKRNHNAATGPDTELFVVMNSGDVYALSPSGTAKIRNAVFQLDGNGLTRYSGNNLTIDPGVSGNTKFLRNGVQVNSIGSGVTQFSGSGAPSIAAALGDAYWRTDGGAGTWLYRCTTAGVANVSSWTAVL